MMLLRLAAVSLLLLAPLHFQGGGPVPAQSLKDDDFAEFEDDDLEFDFEVSDDEDFAEEGKGAGPYQEEEEEEEDEGDFDDVDTGLGDEEDDESFEPDLDEEEFEKIDSTGKLEDIEISESAIRTGPMWRTYILEMVVVGGMLVYLLNYFFGRSRNSSMAHSWLNAHMDILQSNFAIVGDTGEGDDLTEGELVKVGDDTYTLWCSGRYNCSGLLVHMQFSRRHDLVGVAMELVQPKRDMISLIFQLSDEDEMDSFVLAIGTRKILQKMQKEYEDLKNFPTGTIRPVSKAEPLYYICEIAEAMQCFMSERNCSFLSKHSHDIDSIHITDQYTGFVQDTEDSETVVVRKPEKRIVFNFYASAFDKDGPCLKFALQVLDQIKNIRLSRESRDKAIKNRTTVSATLDKLQHAQRQEAAQQRREDKIRARKEKNMLLSESDPDRARKLEEKENKRARKKMQPKIKSMKMS